MLLSVPGRLVPTLLDHLRPKLSDAAHATLVRFQVTTQLQNGTPPHKGRRTRATSELTRPGFAHILGA
jgi:hypothetical protein